MYFVIVRIIGDKLHVDMVETSQTSLRKLEHRGPDLHTGAKVSPPQLSTSLARLLSLPVNCMYAERCLGCDICIVLLLVLFVVCSVVFDKCSLTLPLCKLCDLDITTYLNSLMPFFSSTFITRSEWLSSQVCAPLVLQLLFSLIQLLLPIHLHCSQLLLVVVLSGLSPLMLILVLCWIWIKTKALSVVVNYDLSVSNGCW